MYAPYYQPIGVRLDDLLLLIIVHRVEGQHILNEGFILK